MDSFFPVLFGSQTNIGYTLYYATPLIFTGLSRLLGRFERALQHWSRRSTHTGRSRARFYRSLQLPMFVAVPVAFLTVMLTGGLALISGALRAYRGVHEVLSTILLNFCGLRNREFHDLVFS